MIKKYQIIVVGAGHAGCEAAWIAAKMRLSTLLLTMNIDTIAQLSCNPAIGGPAAKSHLVREIDALGGIMGKIIDKSFINIRLLNESRGPAVHALRAQADKIKYRAEMTLALQSLKHLDVRQGFVTEVLVSDGKAYGVKTKNGTEYHADAIILAPGTFLGGVLVFGDIRYPGGRVGEPASNELSENLKSLGFQMSRFQTATPPRLHADSIDFSKLNEQKGDTKIRRFSFDSERVEVEQLSCWYTRTNEKTVEVIRDNLHRSPILTGSVTGKGPRFCPSIDRKVIRFPDKVDHQIFLEPEGRYTKELYCLGLTTAMPEDVQELILRTIPGLENAKIMRAGYAVEYDFILPWQVKLSLETKLIENLFTAGQINGTSGYEEAGAQGIIAGINAAHKVLGRDEFVLKRSQAYIGVLIDDLVTKGTDEPYRMMTSRAEYRLLLRQDNADLRLRPIGHQLGLISEEYYARFEKKRNNIERTLRRLRETTVSPTEEVRSFLIEKGSGDLKKSVSLFDILRRPEISYNDLVEFFDLETLDEEEIEQVEIICKFEGYVERQQRQIEEFEQLERVLIPRGLNYRKIPGLRTEAREKLSLIQPLSLGQASRIPGVTAADINVLLVVLKGVSGDVSTGA
ncbi:MAG: tRNA uridine-5-carboxymethylaminomethyl(34) synthesis enzyme MnmG [Firmicutes bacterium]|nr:tRNA uridine-5-carboxymethylaminomethyl(34) synthesis enzyme MnmG [Bacillota bacterium]